MTDFQNGQFAGCRVRDLLRQRVQRPKIHLECMPLSLWIVVCFCLMCGDCLDSRMHVYVRRNTRP